MHATRRLRADLGGMTLSTLRSLRVREERRTTDMDDGNEELFELTPERATPLRYVTAALVLVTETAQAFANFCGMVTTVTARHVLQETYDKEFQGIVKFNDDTSCLGSGCPESED